MSATNTSGTADGLTHFCYVVSNACADATSTGTCDCGRFWVSIKGLGGSGTVVPEAVTCKVCGQVHAWRSRYWRALCSRAIRQAFEHRLIFAQWLFRLILADPRPDWWPGSASPRELRSALPQPQRAAALPYRRCLRPRIKSRRRREWRPKGRRGVA